MRSVAIGSLLFVSALGGCSQKPPEPNAPPPVENSSPPVAPAGSGATDNPNATREKFQRIRSDMTQAEVEQILGPGVRVPRSEILRAIRSNGPPGRTDSTVLKWQNGRNILLLELTQQQQRLGVRAGWYVTEKADGTVSYILLGDQTPAGP